MTVVDTIKGIKNIIPLSSNVDNFLLNINHLTPHNNQCVSNV